MPDQPTPPPYPARRYAWYVVAVLTLTAVSANVDRYILALLVPTLKRDLHLTDTQIGYLLGASFAVVYAILTIPIARLADRANRRNIMAVGVALWSVFTAGCALAQGYGRLLVMRFGVGIGEATLEAPSISLLADYFPRERLGRAMGVYRIGIFFGAGLAYFIGAAIVGLMSAEGMMTLPIIGAIRPWQTVFLIAGLPGLGIALLMLTIREPVRRSPSGVSGALPWSVIFGYLRANVRTFVSLNLAYTCSALVNFALAFWVSTFFVRTYGWSVSHAGKVQGILTMTIGVAAVVTGGWVADWFVKRGKIDGPLRVGLIGAAGMLLSATAMPLAPTATIAVAWLAVVNFFAAFPYGAASAAVAEIVPGPMRAQGAAIYFLTLNLVSVTVGPSSVAFLTDRVFGYEAALRYSLATVPALAMSLAITLFLFGMPAYRRTVEQRENWRA